MMLTPAPFPRRARILLLAPFLYGDQASSGGGVLCWAQLQQLALDADLAFLGYSGIESAALESQHRAALSVHCQVVTAVPLQISKWSVLKARLGSLCLTEPELAALCRTPAMERALQHALQTFKPDLVWIQFPQMAQYIQCCGEVPAVMDVQDAYTLSGFRQAQRRQGGAALRSWLDWVAWARYEARHYARFKAVLTLSEQDAQVLGAMNPAVRSSSMGLPLGSARRAMSSCDPMRVGFAGSFGHQPNLEGLGWFLKQVWPQVASRLPRAHLLIAGRNPPSHLTALAGAGIEFVGFVPDIMDFYAANAVTVVPLVSGGGVKIKTVEAMLAGSAVVATRIGIEGTSALAGTHALIEDDPSAFALAIERVLNAPALREALAAAAREHAHALFSAPAWRSRVSGLLQTFTSGSNASRVGDERRAD